MLRTYTALLFCYYPPWPNSDMPPKEASSMSEIKFPLEALSSMIAQNASIVSNYLGSEHLAQPSFDSDGPCAVIPSDSPPNIQQARQNLIAAALEMAQLATGPSEFLPNLATGVRFERLYHEVHEEAYL